MQVESTPLEGLQVIHQFHAQDDRGVFVKTFHTTRLLELGIDFTMQESFYSISHQDVIRGMHFQHPPHDHAKIVFCTEGAILDVALDIRKSSPTYGQFFATELSAENFKALYIPSGFAHGFKALTPQALTFYFVSSENHKPADDGILYSSFGLDWEITSPIISERDRMFPTLERFSSPF